MRVTRKWVVQALSHWACLHGSGGLKEGKVTRLGGVTPSPYTVEPNYDEDPVIYSEKHLRARQNYS